MTAPDTKAPPPKDPELDAAVLRVPHWRALGLGLGIAVLILPMLWYLATVRGRGGSGVEGDWLDGSEWRVVEVDRKPLPRAGRMTFQAGRLRIEADDCAPREVPYRLTEHGIVLTLPMPASEPTICGNPAIDEVWRRLPDVAGLTRYGTGLALTDKDGRSLIRTRR